MREVSSIIGAVLPAYYYALQLRQANIEADCYAKSIVPTDLQDMIKNARLHAILSNLSFFVFAGLAYSIEAYGACAAGEYKKVLCTASTAAVSWCSTFIAVSAANRRAHGKQQCGIEPCNSTIAGHMTTLAIAAASSLVAGQYVSTRC